MAGAAGHSIVKLLSYMGVANIIVCDTHGIIYKGRDNQNFAKEEIANLTNKDNIKGTLLDALESADVFIGVSVANVLTPEMISKMRDKPVIFALANPEPEIKMELAKSVGVEIIATGRSDYPNQVNNVLAFPAIFRSSLDAKAREINMEMKLAAAKAIASIVAESDMRSDYIIPKPFDLRSSANRCSGSSAGSSGNRFCPT